MKIKFLSIAFAFVVALALASCGSSGPIEPTGDLDKDVEALVDKMKDVKDEADLKTYMEDYKKFSEYYNKEGKDADFQKALDDATKDNPDLKNAMEGIKLLGGLEGMADKADEMKEKAEDLKDKALEEGSKALDEAQKKLDEVSKALDK